MERLSSHVGERRRYMEKSRDYIHERKRYMEDKYTMALKNGSFPHMGHFPLLSSTKVAAQRAQPGEPASESLK